MKLTPRQTEIITLIANGYTDKEIASQLFISVRTVNLHAAKVLDRLSAKSRAHAVANCFKMRIMSIR